MQRYIFLLLMWPLLAHASQNNLAEEIDKLNLKKMSAIVIHHQGKTVFEAYYNGTQPNELHDVRSASKSLTGLLFGIALEEGLFASEKDKVRPLFADYEPVLFDSPNKKDMTFFDLLSMTNPLECNDWENISAGNEERMYMQADWVQFVLNLPEGGHRPWEPKPSDRKFGRMFHYCTAGISLTGAAIEHRSKQGLDKYAQARLFDPLDIREVTWPYSPMGLTQAGGGLRISARDFLKIGVLMLNEGRWGQRQLINPAWVKRSFTRYSEAMPEMRADYGLTWWIFDYPQGDKTITAFAAAGNGGNYLFIVPALSLAAVINSTAYNTKYMHKQAHQVFTDVILKNFAK